MDNIALIAIVALCIIAGAALVAWMMNFIQNKNTKNIDTPPVVVNTPSKVIAANPETYEFGTSTGSLVSLEMMADTEYTGKGGIRGKLHLENLADFSRVMNYITKNFHEVTKIIEVEESGGTTILQYKLTNIFGQERESAFLHLWTRKYHAKKDSNPQPKPCIRLQLFLI